MPVGITGVQRSACLLWGSLAVAGGLPASRPPAVHVLENQAVRLEVESADASVRLHDKRSGVMWRLNPPQVVLKDQTTFDATPVSGVRRGGSSLRFSSKPGIEFQLRLLSSPPAVEYSFAHSPKVAIQEVMLLHRSLPIEPGERNYYAIPHRMGVLLPVEGDQPFRRKLRAYEVWYGYHMAMFGAVKDGSALLATWESPYTDLVVEYAVAPRKELTCGIALRRDARSLVLQPLGRGGYVEIAKAYRPIARQRGFLKTLAEKACANPHLERFFGAADIKPFVLSRSAPNTRWNPGPKERVSAGFTFQEAADLAEHLKNDLGMDRALMVLAGWNHRGYDNALPDILPAAPELGGNEALAATAKRVRALGWLFGLHDNYRDSYRDAPTWNESFVMRNADGSLHKGFVWAGGLSYIVCPRKALELAARPQNLPEVRKLFGNDLYLIDCTLAAPPYECFAPDHPVTPAEDIHYRTKLLDYVRKIFGAVGSEEGKEWGVSHADYFEGLMGHRTGYLRYRDVEWGASTVIPLFELVYGDAIPIYSHQSNRARPDAPGYILDHILYAEMPVYSFGRHRYWTDPAQEYKPPPGSESRLVFARGGRLRMEDQFIKNTYEVLSPLNRVTALLPMTDHRFVTRDRTVEATRFGEDVHITVNYGNNDFTSGRAVLPQYGFLVESPSLVAFYARRYGRLDYSDPPLFVLWSQDGRPLSSSERVRIYRAFGDRRVEWNGKIVEVESEMVVSATEGARR